MLDNAHARWIAVMWASLIVFVPQNVFADPADSFETHVVTAEASSDDLLGLADVLVLSNLARWLPLETVESGYLRIVETSTDETVRALANYQRLRQAFSTRNVDLVEEIEPSLGYIENWSFIGPFANEGMSAFAARLPLELDGIVSEAIYDGKVTEVGWRQTEHVSETGYFAVSDIVQPSYNAVMYVATSFETDDAINGSLAVAIDGAYRIWLDGEPLAEQIDHLGGFAIRDRIPIELTRGEHVLVVKIGTDTSIGGLHARILGEEGEPIALTYSAANEGPPLQAATSWNAPITLADRIDYAYIQAGETAENAVKAAYILRSMQPADPSRPWDPYVERALSEEDLLTPDDLALLASIAESYWIRSLLIEQAAANSSDPEILLAYAQNLLSRMDQNGREEAAIVINRVLEQHPDHPQAQMMYAEMLHEFGLGWSAFDVAYQATELSGWAPAALGSLRRLAENVHREDLFETLYLRYIERNCSAIGTWGAYADILRATNRTDEIVPILQSLQETLPLSLPLLKLIAGEQRAVADTIGATETLSSAIELCPGCAELFEQRGEIALEVGDRQAAVDDFNAALVFSPQNAELRALVSNLTNTEDTFYAEYRFDLDELITLQVSAESEESNTENLTDYTILVDQQITQVFENGLAMTYIQEAFDIHSRSGADALRSTSISYSPDSEIVDVLAVRIRKADGSVREVYNASDFSAYSGPSAVYYDVHTRRLSFPDLDEGDLLSIEYTVADVSYRNLFGDYFGDIWFVEDYHPKEFARYGLILPTTREIFTNQEEITFGQWTESEENGQHYLFFEATDLPAIYREDNAPGAAESLTYLSVSTYETWDDLGRWYWNLIENQLVVSTEIEETVAGLIEGITDRREIVSAIHNYVVRNTRYVGLEFGIHGYKPYRTSDCFSRRFGDCKDTASLMNVMLEVAGIEANIVLIRTRDLGQIEDFPPSLALFNHAIAYVPEFDLFLDGTAGFSGSTELPTMDQGASAIIILDGEGAREVTTPILPSEMSISETIATIDLRGDEAVATIEERRIGSYAPGVRRRYEAEEQRESDLTQTWSRIVPGSEVTESSFNDLTDIEENVAYQFVLTGGDWVQYNAGDPRISIVASNWTLTANLAGSSERSLPVVTNRLFTVRKTFSYLVPETWTPNVDFNGEIPTVIESAFGRISFLITFSESVLTTEMEFQMTASVVSLEEYSAFREFLSSVDDLVNRMVRFEIEEVTQ